MLRDYSGPANDPDLLESLVGDTVQGWYLKDGRIHLVFSDGQTVEMMSPQGLVAFARKDPTTVQQDLAELRERLNRHKQEMANIERNLERVGTWLSGN